MASKFVVIRKEPELITPSAPTPHELKLLSDIDDQDGFRFHVPLICFYKYNPSMDGADPVDVIRQALAKALVFYYPLAGRLQEGRNRKLMVNCSGQGALFIEANAFVTLDQLGDAIMPPCLCFDELLFNVPGSDGILNSPLLLIQVTRFTCKGFVVALRFNHTMIDAFGVKQFLSAIGEFAYGATTPSVLPTWQRHEIPLFNARDPPRVTCIHHEYEDVADLSDVDIMNQSEMVKRPIFLSIDDISNLRQHLPSYLRSNATTLELIIACLWISRTAALNLHPEQVVRVCVLLNWRLHKRLSHHVPSGYYGNSFVYPAAVTKAGLLSTNPLEYAVKLIQEAKKQVTEDYIRSVANLMVVKGRPKYTTIGNYIVADNTRNGADELDFGWGRPLFAGPATSLSIVSFISNYKYKDKDGIVVPICLPKSAIVKFEEEVKRLTSFKSNLVHPQGGKCNIQSML